LALSVNPNTTGALTSTYRAGMLYFMWRLPLRYRSAHGSSFRLRGACVPGAVRCARWRASAVAYRALWRSCEGIQFSRWKVERG